MAGLRLDDVWEQAAPHEIVHFRLMVAKQLACLSHCQENGQSPYSVTSRIRESYAEHLQSLASFVKVVRGGGQCTIDPLD